MKRVKVLFIAGTGRSGTTLLERILDQSPELNARGELRYIWERSFSLNELCGCGTEFLKCENWRDALNIVPDELTPKEYGQNVLKKQYNADKIKLIPLLILGLLPRRLLSFHRHLEKLYTAISQNSGDSIIIDSSKYPSYLLILALAPFIDLRIVHMVRDPRGVSYSWNKKKIRPEVVHSEDYMTRFSYSKSAIDWGIYNLLIWSLHKLFPLNPYYIIQYERFVDNPIEELEKLCLKMNISPKFVKHTIVSGDTAYLQPSHTAAGNPMRFINGEIKLKTDNEWKYKMNHTSKVIVTLLTAPFLWLFDYRISTH